MSQGVVKLWLEIIPTSVPPEEIKVWDITPKDPYEIEVRICVLNCKDIVMMDAEGTSDVFFKGYFDQKEEIQETDTHYRNQDGKPDFQYRLVYKIHHPRKTNKFTLQAYDRDFFKSNDIIGEAQIDLEQIIEDCSLIKAPVCLNKKYYEDVILKNKPDSKMKFGTSDPNKFWLPMQAKKDGKIISNGEVRVQIDILPRDLAEKNPVGKARDQPNHSPQLP